MTTFFAGLILSLSLIMAIGPQNAHVLRMGLTRRHLWLTVVVCAMADIFMIATGVIGFSSLGDMPDLARQLMALGGAAFLAIYGWKAFARWNGHRLASRQAAAVLPASSGSVDAGANQGTTGAPKGRVHAALTALAFSILNPHAWIDTALLIGTAAVARGSGQMTFGAGAAAGSAIWFVSLGSIAGWLGTRPSAKRIWQQLDLVVALMMWGTAAVLLKDALV